MQSFIENLLSSTPVELTASIITWFIIFVVVGTCARLVANYYSQGKFKRSKRSVLKEETTKLSGATLFMALFTGIAGMGTMFAVNELIKTNKMVAESTEAAVKAAESAEKQTQEIIKSNILNAHLKEVEYSPKISTNIKAKYTEPFCILDFELQNNSNVAVGTKQSYLKYGNFFIPFDAIQFDLEKYINYIENQYHDSISNILFGVPESTATLSPSSSVIHLHKKLELKESDSIKNLGGFESFCNGLQMHYSKFGFGYLFHMTTGLVEKMLGGGVLVNKNTKSLQHYFHFGGIYTRKKYLPGYVLDYKLKNKEYDFENLSIISNDLFILANLQRILDASGGLVGSIEREKNLKMNLEKFNISSHKDYFQKYFSNRTYEQGFFEMYGDIEARVIKTLEEDGTFKIIKLSDKLNEINKPGICERLGYGLQCENLMR